MMVNDRNSRTANEDNNSSTIMMDHSIIDKSNHGENLQISSKKISFFPTGHKPKILSHTPRVKRWNIESEKCLVDCINLSQKNFKKMDWRFISEMMNIKLNTDHVYAGETCRGRFRKLRKDYITFCAKVHERLIDDILCYVCT